MGEVYRARDTKLGRDVAIKVLPSVFTADRDRLARFEREARVLATLNHPHIGAIYGLEDGDGTPALVLELVEGETLAEKLAHGLRLRAPLSVGEVLGLRADRGSPEAAHEQGIIHRDLKPANIKVRADGAVKVLDFGLAKLAGPDVKDVGQTDPAHLANSPTLTSPTIGGAILGTAPYMSPEQARGKAVDKRSDIWAFGCVLYEMLTGVRAFRGDDITETLASVVAREPDWSKLPAGTPAAISKLLIRCLAKDPRERLPYPPDARLKTSFPCGSRGDCRTREQAGRAPRVGHCGNGTRRFDRRRGIR
jgi:serine/threonine protein kinase